MINNNDLQAMLVNLNAPNGILDSFMAYLEGAGARYDQSKTLAMFCADSKALITNLSSVTLPYGSTNSLGASNGQYPASEHFLIFGIRVLTGTGADPATTAYTAGVTDGSTQGSLLNINNNGTTVIKDMPLSLFPQSTGTADTNAGYITLVEPILWLGQTTLQVILNQPNPTAVATSNIDVQLIGLKLI